MSIIKTILVTASGTDNDTAAFAAALAVARPFGAYLGMPHVRVDAVNAAVAMTTDAGTGALTAGLIEQLERDARDREKTARAGFDSFCAGAGLAASAPTAGASGPSAEWHAGGGTSGTRPPNPDPRRSGAAGNAREWVFGGFTQRMLCDTPLPILMAH